MHLECVAIASVMRTVKLRQKRGDTHVGTIEKKYGRDFDVRSDTHLSDLLKREGVESLNDLINSTN
jgi:hypothetical protein